MIDKTTGLFTAGGSSLVIGMGLGLLLLGYIAIKIKG